MCILLHSEQCELRLWILPSCVIQFLRFMWNVVYYHYYRISTVLLCLESVQSTGSLRSCHQKLMWASAQSNCAVQLLCPTLILCGLRDHRAYLGTLPTVDIRKFRSSYYLHNKNWRLRHPKKVCVTGPEWQIIQDVFTAWYLLRIIHVHVHALQTDT